MPAKPPPVDYLKVAPYTPADLVFHVTGGVLNACTLLAAVLWLVRSRWEIGPAGYGVLLALAVGVYCADFVSGLLHWAFDTWFDEANPVLRRMVIMVREHHIYPTRIFQFSFYHDAGVLSWIAFFVTAPVILPALFRERAGPIHYYAVVSAVVFSLLIVFMLEFHKVGHRPRPGKVVRLLQHLRLLLPFRHHMRHHSGNYDQNYCLINGVADLTLGRLGVFRGLERLISRLTGVVPQQNDHEWLRRFGRL